LANKLVKFYLKKVKCYFLKVFYGYTKLSPTTHIVEAKYISKDLETGCYCFVNSGCRISPKVKFDKYVLVGKNVMFVGDDHIYDNPNVPMIFSGRPKAKATVVGADVWIGSNSVVLSGIKIGDGSIIAAGSVVTTDVPARTIFGGVPAKKLKNRFNSELKDLEHIEMLSKTNVVRNFSEKKN